MTRAALTTLAAATLAACSGSVAPTPPPPPIGRIEVAAAAYAVGEAAPNVAITLRRVGGNAGGVSVWFELTPGTARPAEDYEDDYGLVTWAAGDAADKTIAVWMRNDLLVEGDETLTLVLSSPTGGAALGNASATVTIRDDETPAAGALRFAAPAFSVDEAAGTATITVERSGGSAGPVSVLCSTAAGGTAIAGADYEAAWASLTWPDGDATPRTLEIPILDDASPEAYETVAVALDPPTGGAAIAGASRADLTIRNDDTVVRFGEAAFSAGENGGTRWIPVVKVGETPRVEVRVAATGGTATAGADYAPLTASTAVWNERESGTLQLAFTTLQDTIQEGDETVALSLVDLTPGATLGTPSTATLTILDDEPPPQGLLELAAGAYTVSNYAGTVTISVRRTGGTTGTVGVTWATADGTALAGQDYTATSGTLAWGPGDAAPRTFTLPIADDLVVEHGEAFQVSLSSPTGGAAIGPQRTAQVTITDDWARRGQPVFMDSDVTAWDDRAVRHPSVVRRGPADFVMFYQGGNVISGTLSTEWKIGRAVSTDGITWTRQPAATWVLQKGAPGKFDELGVGKPSVLFDGTTWHMWYSNEQLNTNEDYPAAPKIGYATSADGITWVRQNGGDAVLDAGPYPENYFLDTYGVSAPSVVREDDGTYTMWFTGHQSYYGRVIGRATSPDGVQWTKAPASDPVLDSALGIDQFDVWDPSVVKDGDTYRAWYVSGINASKRLCYASSPDGISWTAYPGNPIFEVPWVDWWDSRGTFGPSAVKDGERWLVWYFANDGLYTVGDVGLATNP